MDSHSGTYRFGLSCLLNKFYPGEMKNIIGKCIEVVNKLDQRVHHQQDQVYRQASLNGF